MQKTKPLAPFLKWAGGKTWLAPRLAKMYGSFCNTHTWVEPFCGALGATLGVMPERAILSDVNPHLINLYRQIDQLNYLDWTNSEQVFNLIRKAFNLANSPDSGFNPSDRWKARAFYYLNRTCFNGLCRFNLKGEFNVPYGKYKKPKLDHDFFLYRKTFRYWDFYHLAFDDILNPFLLPSSSFIYADPPYDDGFTSYSGSFTWDDQVSLATTLASLNCPVVASNKATDRIIDLYQGLGFDLEFVDVRRRIACNGDRTSATEILATRNL